MIENRFTAEPGEARRSVLVTGRAYPRSYHDVENADDYRHEKSVLHLKFRVSFIEWSVWYDWYYK